MIVADANLIVYLFIRGRHSSAADRLLNKDGNWIAPQLWLDEFVNVLCTYEREGLITPDVSTNVIDDALRLMEGCSYEIPPERILAVARRTGCSGYDSQYVALAEDLGLRLYTFDRKIIARCTGLAVLPT